MSNLLHPRYSRDSGPVVGLSGRQRQMIDQIHEKVESGIYNFEETACPLCDVRDYLSLSEVDRYGLYHPVKICRQCGLVQITPRMTEDSLAEFYNNEYRPLYGESWSFYSHNRDQSLQVQQFQHEKRNAEQIYSYLDSVSPEGIAGYSVFDVGCGPGGTLAYFQDEGHRTAGCDLSEQEVAFGRNRGLSLYDSDVSEVELDWQPDIVILSHVIEHFTDPISVLESIRELASEDVLVYIETPGIKYIRPGGYYNSDFKQFLQNAHTYYFSAATLENVLQVAGFSSCSIDESIKSVFQPSQSPPEIESDCRQTLSRLKRIESSRRLRLNQLASIYNRLVRKLS